MANPITDDLADFFADTLTAQPGSMNAFGEWAASGDALAMPAYISGRNRRVRNGSGEEVVSSVKVIVAVTPALVDAWIALGWSGWIDEDWIAGDDALPSILSVQGYRYTLPKRFSPRLAIEALAIGHSSDENGAHHETVYFP